jgi:biopolymer transport protein ExbD
MNTAKPFQLPAMVDIVFILLSFFVMATQFRLLENDFALGYQKQATAQGSAREDFPETIRVRLAPAEQGVAITIGQAALALDDYDGITERLSEMNMPGIDVLMEADPSLTVAQVARALDAVLASPMNRVSVTGVDSEG